MITVGGRTYSVEEAQTLIHLLEDDIRREEDALDGPYVRVKYLAELFSPVPRLYRDPTGDCNVGDLVLVPDGNGADAEHAAQVVSKHASMSDFRQAASVFPSLRERPKLSVLGIYELRRL